MGESPAAAGGVVLPITDIDQAINRAVALKDAGRDNDAIDLCLDIIAVEPNRFHAWNNLGNLYSNQNRWDEAVEAFKRALEIKPGSKQTQLNMGVVEHESGHSERGEATITKALESHPGDTLLRWNRSLLRLSQGNFAEGWEDYEARWDGAKELPFKARPHPQPRWDGTPTDSVVLVWGEQGAGDEIIYSDMLDDLIAKQRRVIFECNYRLVSLFQRTYPEIIVVANHQKPHPICKLAAYQIPLASLGRLYRKGKYDFARRRRPLEADQRKVDGCRRVLGGQPVIGLSWRSKNPKIEHHKSVPLPVLAKALTDVAGAAMARMLDLQYGDTDEERLALKWEHGIDLYHVTNLDMFEDMDGLAALVKACSVIVTVSNTTAHLAAALGVPTLVMVPCGYGHLWYWMRSGTFTPWYDCAMIFRQDQPGEWGPVLEAVAAEVKDRLKPLEPVTFDDNKVEGSQLTTGMRVT